MTPTRRIKVLRIIARLNTGGPTVHTVLLTSGLNRERFSSCLVTGVIDATEGDMRYYAEQMNVVPLVVPELGRRPAVGNDIRALFKLYRIIRDHQPDIIDTHTTKAGALGRLAGIMYNCWARIAGRQRAKLVHTFHGHIFHGYFSPLLSWALVMGERFLGFFTDRVIAVSESVKRDLVERYKICREDKVTVARLGFDFSWVSELDDRAGCLRKEFRIPPAALTIGVVGRLTAIKNQALLFSALSRMRRDKIVVLVLGDGGLREELVRTVRELGLENQVVFTGWQRELARMFADLDIVCLTSRNEGTPVVLIEAMAAGRPFVATRVGGVPDLVVGDGRVHDAGFEIFANGILVPPDDPDVLASALGYLAERAEVRRAMGWAGQAAVVRRFGKQRLLEETEMIYAALVEAPSRTGRCDR